MQTVKCGYLTLLSWSPPLKVAAARAPDAHRFPTYVKTTLTRLHPRTSMSLQNNQSNLEHLIERVTSTPRPYLASWQTPLALPHIRGQRERAPPLPPPPPLPWREQSRTRRLRDPFEENTETNPQGLAGEVVGTWDRCRKSRRNKNQRLRRLAKGRKPQSIFKKRISRENNDNHSISKERCLVHDH